MDEERLRQIIREEIAQSQAERPKGYLNWQRALEFAYTASERLRQDDNKRSVDPAEFQARIQLLISLIERNSF